MKGDNKVSTDVRAVGAMSEGKDEAELAVPTVASDINDAYEEELYFISTAPQTERKPDPLTQQEDYYGIVQTNILLAWTSSNVRVTNQSITGVLTGIFSDTPCSGSSVSYSCNWFPMYVCIYSDLGAELLPVKQPKKDLLGP